MKNRAKSFAVRIIRLVEILPQTRTADLIGSRLLENSTAMGANYMASYKAKSPEDFIEKMTAVEELADKCIYWMELLVEADLVDKEITDDLLKEAQEIASIAVSSVNTARGKRR
jgi:four helix bundle protein